MATVEAVVAVSHHQWAQRLMRWIIDHSEDVRLIDHQVFHRDQALGYDYDCLVVDVDSSLLDRALVDELHQRGRSVIAVAEATPETPGVVDELGVDRLVDRHSEPARLATVIAEVARTRADFADVVDGLDVTAVPAAPDTAPAGPVGSWVTVVTGALEGVGATETLVEMAAALARRGERVTVVDADLVAASLAQRLGLAYDRHVQTAVDAVVHASGRLDDAVQPSPAGGFDVIVGVEPGKWAEVEAHEALAVVEAVRARGGHVLIAVGSPLEELVDERHDVARALVGSADQVVVAADSAPVGVVRLCRWLVTASELTDVAGVHAVFTRSPSAAAADELEHELVRTAPAVGGVWHLPADAKVAQAAWRGELAARGRFTRAVAQLVDGALPATVELRRRRRRPLREASR